MAEKAPERFTIPVGMNGCPTTDQIRRDAQRAVALPDDVETTILNELTRPLAPEENHLAGGENRERALREIFDALSVAQALTLGHRLDIDRDADRVAAAFRRLTSERRQRLRSYLADTRRRLALSSMGRNVDERT